MKTARDILNDALVDVGLIADDLSSDYLIRRLTAAGYQIVPPGGIHKPTREAAAKSLECLLPEFGGMKPPTDETDRMVDAARREAALFIRALGATHG